MGAGRFGYCCPKWLSRADGLPCRQPSSTCPCRSTGEPSLLAQGERQMVDLLEQIRKAVDELTPLLGSRAVDIEMPRLTVVADAGALQRALIAVIERAALRTEGSITVRTTRRGAAARIEVTGERRREDQPVASNWPAAVTADVEAIEGRMGETDAPVVWLSVPVAGSGAPDA